MRVAVDARMAHWTGVGRYIREVFRAAARLDDDTEFIFVTNPGDDTAWVPDAPRFRLAAFARPIKPYSLAEQRILGREMSRFDADLIHFPQFNVPLFRRLRYVVTIHDLIYVHFPEDCPSYLAHLAVKKMIRSAVKRAGLILSVSQATKDDIVDTFGTDPEKIRVSHLGAMELDGDAVTDQRVAAARAAVGVEGPYLLYTGNHSPHKNLATLLKVLRTLNDGGAGLTLVVTGKRDRHTEVFLGHVAREGLGEAVRLAGFVPDEHLFPLYRGAEVLVFPSLYEGFGLPPLEAFACGTPVVASNRSSIPEVLGDAALLVNPTDVAAMAAAIARVRGEAGLRDDLVRRGRDRLASFSWEKTARKTIDTFRAMVD